MNRIRPNGMSALRLAMRKSIISLGLMVVTAGVAQAAGSFIDIRISVKVIDYNGEHNPGTEAQFDALLALSN